PVEREIATLANTYEIPLGDLAERLDELPKHKEIVVYCRTGQRSGRAVQLLRDAGFSHARNLIGGIRAWAEVIDPTMASY
ncbi:MAG TPA: rhodanese-like domain-containing protein, partial [Candidatus Eremiobacteraceae bacterium]|nr:rhodanese-like domain-containing protein [Candidatus Eremiobacteraceae bacterium]